VIRFAWPIGVLGLLALWGLAAFGLVLNGARTRWDRVPARVIASGVESYEGACHESHPTLTCTYWRAQVRYRYEVAGAAHESTTLGAMAEEGGERAAMEARAAKYPAGAEVTAWVNPKDPAEALLEPEFPPLFVAVFALAGLLWLAVWGLAGKMLKPKDA
jgi:hypothetical protein